MTKEEIKSRLVECARKLGRTPKYAEVRQMASISRFWIQKHFGTLARAFREIGFEPVGMGHRVETRALMEDWAGIARKLGKLPTLADYRKLGRFSVRPFFERCKSWVRAPQSFRVWARNNKQEKKWADVLAMAAEREQQTIMVTAPEDKPRARRNTKLDRPVYGAPLMVPGLRYEPVNEQGVLFAFGMVAEKLGLEIERVQTEFPDCEAMREIGKGRWQRVKIELEFASKNYLLHKHRLDGCDIIVCWIHNWPGCPERIEVIELRKVMRGLGN